MKNIFITGANKGIGLGIVKDLVGKSFGTNIYMGCRNLEQTQSEIKNLKNNLNAKQNLIATYTDMLDSKTFNNIIVDLKNEKLDLFINNAGINTDKNDNLDMAKRIIKTNYENVRALTEKIIHEDKLNHNSMILNVSSYYARLGALKSKDMKQKFEKVESLDDLEELKNEFLERFPESLKWYAITWPCQAYSFSKLLLNYYTKLLSESEYIKEKQIQVYAVHPSWVRTDMGGDKAPNDVDYGVKSILAPLSFNTLDKELQGKMLFNGKVEK